MGETWRNLSTSDKEKYAEGGDISDDMETELTPDEKRRRIIRVARRLQGDVSCTIIYIHSTYIITSTHTHTHTRTHTHTHTVLHMHAYTYTHAVYSEKLLPFCNCNIHTLFIVQATQLESVGCEVATLMVFDGQTITVGSTKGKQFLHSHPAILSSFNAYFHYGNYLYNDV